MLLPYIKLSLKTKRVLELVSLPHFLHDVWRKILLWLCSVNWPNCVAWLPLLRKILGNIICVLELFVYQVETSNIISSRFSIWPKSHDKNWNSLRMKRAFKINKYHFLSFLKGFHWSKWNNFFERWESDFKSGCVCGLWVYFLTIYSDKY